MIRAVDLGPCPGVEWSGDLERTAVVLPGRLLGGTPSCYYAASALNETGRRVVQVWEGYDESLSPLEWATTRAEAALAYAGGATLLVAKSMTTLLTGFAAEHGLAGVWLTPLLDQPECVDGLRRRTAPALLVGGTNDPAWDGRLARELADEVLELEDADHGLARIDQLPRLVDAVSAFADPVA